MELNLIKNIILFHITCIILFTCIYWYLRDHFERQSKHKLMPIDYLLLATTIQASVGISDFNPISFWGKLTMIIQQFIMIVTNVFALTNFNVLFFNT